MPAITRATLHAWLLISLSLAASQRLSEPEHPPGSDSTSQQSQNSAAGTRPDIQEEAWSVLTEGLRSRRVNKRVEAIKALSLLPGNRRAETFALRAMSDKNFRVRAAAASTLGELRVSKAAPALRSALSDKEAPVVLAAAHALYELKDPSAYNIYYAILMGDKKAGDGLIQSQINRLKDPKQMAEMGFQEGLGFVPYGSMGYEAYRTVMKRGHAPVRAAAARFLASDPDPISEDALIQTALVDKDHVVREAALDALAQRDDPRCAERLERNLHEKSYAVRYRTAAVIIHFGGKDDKRSTP